MVEHRLCLFCRQTGLGPLGCIEGPRKYSYPKMVPCSVQTKRLLERLPRDQAMDPFALVSLGARPGGGGNPCGWRGKRRWMLQTPGRVCSSWAKSHAQSKFGRRKQDKRSQHWVTNELGCLHVAGKVRFCENSSQVGLRISAEVDLTS